MTSRAESSVFWPGITPAIANLRARCRSGNERAPSQPHGPPLAAQEPVYPFQCICADYFKYKGCNYMVVVDRYSGWPIVQQSRDGSSGLVKCLREVFVTYGIADELSSDGGPEFTAEETQQLLSNWGVHHRLSSVALAHSNGRAELGVKTCKRMLMDNTYKKFDRIPFDPSNSIKRFDLCPFDQKNSTHLQPPALVWYRIPVFADIWKLSL